MRSSINVRWAVGLALWSAWRAKVAGGAIALPPVGDGRPSSAGVQDLVLRRVDAALGRLRTRHICFYRSYALASILRPLGVPLVLNIGLRRHRSLQRPWGHCWLTLDGQAVFEKTDAAVPFDEPLHDTGAGVRYWLGRPEAQPFQRALVTPLVERGSVA